MRCQRLAEEPVIPALAVVAGATTVALTGASARQTAWALAGLAAKRAIPTIKTLVSQPDTLRPRFKEVDDRGWFSSVAAWSFGITVGTVFSTSRERWCDGRTQSYQKRLQSGNFAKVAC